MSIRFLNFCAILGAGLLAAGTAFADREVSSEAGNRGTSFAVISQLKESFVSEVVGLDLSPLRTVSVNGHPILANSDGLTVYVFDKDTPGVSNCTAGCAQVWPPVLLSTGQAVRAPLGTIARNDGTQQITFQGRPVYLYAEDDKAGDINGDGLGGIWHIVPVPNL